jgi:hypothetical protein
VMMNHVYEKRALVWQQQEMAEKSPCKTCINQVE